MCTQFYLEDSGTVFKGVRAADIIDQADDVTGHISIRQVVKVREHFMKLRGVQGLFVIVYAVWITVNSCCQKLTVHK